MGSIAHNVICSRISLPCLTPPLRIIYDKCIRERSLWNRRRYCIQKAMRWQEQVLNVAAYIKK